MKREISKASAKQQFFVRRSDGMSVTNSKFDRLVAKEKLPPFDFERHHTTTSRETKIKINKFLEKTL